MASQYSQQQPIMVSKAEVRQRWEEGSIADEELRQLMRSEIERRLRWGYKPTQEQQLERLMSFIKSLREKRMGGDSKALDDQVYEVPISLLKIMMGPRMKISSCYFKHESTTLDEAETLALDLYCKRAQIKDGQRVLDLGCGQGALTFYVAMNFKRCHVTAVTNSASQKEYILNECRELQLSNVDVILEDITKLEMELTYDRILAVGLFEQMKNYDQLLKKISNWMEPHGLLFVQCTCHKTFAYDAPLDEDDWFTEFAFPASSFTTPSASLLLYFQDDVSVLDHWSLSGIHFSRTSEEWLKRLDTNIDRVREIMESFCGSKEGAEKMIKYWRGLCIFTIELFGYKNGEEWLESHIIFKKKK